MKPLLITIFILIFSLTTSVGAYVSESTNYRIDVDSINVSGGTGTSASYSINSTTGEIATGDSSSTNYNINAGYQAMLGSSVTLTLSSPADISLSPNITSGETSNGQVAWTVVTNNSAGYSLSVKASTDPALKSSGGDSIADYVPTGGVDFTWTVSADSSYFGFSPEGDDIASTYQDDGATCGTGSTDSTDSCWGGFTTSNQTITSKSSSTAGSLTTLKIRSEIGTVSNTNDGDYSAQITVTAVVL